MKKLEKVSAINAEIQTQLDVNMQCEERLLKEMCVPHHTQGDLIAVANGGGSIIAVVNGGGSDQGVGDGDVDGGVNGCVEVGDEGGDRGSNGSGNHDIPMSTILKNATLQHFSLCLVPQLKAFCCVHLFVMEATVLTNQKKVTVEEAMSGVQNLIFLAHSFRERAVKVAFESSHLQIDEQDPFEPSVIQPHNPMGEGADDFSFVTAQFIVAIIDCFTLPGCRTLKLRTASRERICQGAVQLTKLLRKRLRFHLQERILDDKKRRHWCLQWAACNLPRVAVIMVVAGHVTDDLECCTDSSTCLLQNPLLDDSFFVEVDLSMDDCRVEGCYLYFDTKNCCWVRGGKAIGRRLIDRHREHAIKAKLTDAEDLNSTFYTT